LAAHLESGVRERSNKPRTVWEQLVHALRFFAIDAVIDVGANTGQYAQRLRRHGWRGPILSFEPLPDVHAALLRAAASDRNWFVAPPVALGASAGRALLERSAESDMSSLLPQSALLREISPSSHVVTRLEVPVDRLDRRPEIRADWQRLFIKLDVQGAEPQVLAGACGLGERLIGVQLEAALVPLYEGEQDFRTLLASLERAGFVLHLLIPGYYERKLARQLQVDMVVFRAAAASGADPS
jgi:FkbM family methyltransferase